MNNLLRALRKPGRRGIAAWTPTSRRAGAPADPAPPASGSPLAALALGLAAIVLSSTPVAGALRLEVDATDAPRRILHARLTVPVRPGPLTLVYPKWIPGYHAPNGPIVDLAGLRMSVAGHALQWRRDAADMFAFHIEVPAETKNLEVALDYLLPSSTDNPNDEPSASARVLDLSWNDVLLYPAGTPARDLLFEARLRLPTGWRYGTALPVAHESSAGIEFQPVALEALVDSPVLAGAHFRRVSLGGAPGSARWLDIAADSVAALELKTEDQAHFSRLVAEAEALFGARHYRDYHFLLTLSDHVAHFGLEHHESSDDRAGERYLLDEDNLKMEAWLLPHELVHSWNGKYRRPAGLATPDYQTPMRGELLWVYEGLTEYLGLVLTARSGLWTNRAFTEYLAWQAAALDAAAGRRWRPLVDTTVAAQLLYLARAEGAAWRRGVDFYPEGALIWLEADVLIRGQTEGRRSLDDFCQRFCGGQNSPPQVLPYALDDVLAALNQVAPFDWRGFFQRRVYEVNPRAPLGGIQEGGWRLAYTNQLSEFLRAREAAEKVTDSSWSIGLSLKEGGAIVDVIPGSPAEKAGLGPAMKLLAVDGRRWTPEILRAAVQTAKTNSAPLELLVENDDFFKTAKVDYHGGEKYPALARDPSKPDRLSPILEPRTLAEPQPAPPPAR